MKALTTNEDERKRMNKRKPGRVLATNEHRGQLRDVHGRSLCIFYFIATLPRNWANMRFSLALKEGSCMMMRRHSRRFARSSLKHTIAAEPESVVPHWLGPADTRSLSSVPTGLSARVPPLGRMALQYDSCGEPYGFDNTTFVRQMLEFVYFLQCFIVSTLE